MYKSDNASAILAAIIPTMVVAIAVTMQPGIVQGLVDYVGVSDVQAGYIASVEVLGLMVGTVLFAIVSSRVPWRSTLAIALLAYAFANFFSAFVASVDILLALRGAAGIASGLVTGMGFSALAVTSKPGRNYGWLVASVIAFSALGFASLPYIYSIGKFQLLMIVVGALGLLSIIPGWFIADSKNIAPTETASRDDGGLLSIPSALALLSNCILFCGLHSGLGLYDPYWPSGWS
jgi:predicted MFS family arabinose efflux permease